MNTKFYHFYPLLEQFKVNEADAPKAPTKDELKKMAARVPRLEDQDEVVSPYTGNTINMKKVKADIEAAKYKIVTQSRLYAPYVHSFDPTIYTWIVPTMATDGVRLFVNPEFADKLSWLGKVFVLIHEIMHCILLHMERGSGFDPETFNIAADLEVNPIIVDTTDDFDEKFVKEEIGGLYDKKYLNMPVEQIYHDILKNQPPLPPPPPPIKIDPTKMPKGSQPQGPPPPPQPPQKATIEITPGTKVRVKSTGQVGIVKKVNKDGTFEVDTTAVTESLFFPLLLEGKYKREELIPILPAGSSGEGGQGGGMQIQDEYEQEGGEGKESEKNKSQQGKQQGKGKGQGKEGEQQQGEGSGGEGGLDQSQKAKEKAMMGKAKSMETDTSKMSAEDMDAVGKSIAGRLRNSDRGQAGAMIDPRLGEEIAKASGYDLDEINAGEDGRTKWESNAREIQKTVQKMKDAGSGRGDALIQRLGKILKGVANWRSMLKAYVGTALSPEKEWRIGAKKHLHKAEEYLRRGQKTKKDALKKCVVCVDVSGSMWSGNTFEKLIAEVNSIIFTKKIKEVTVLFFDDGVDPGSVQVVKQNTKVWKPKSVKGGGGTDFQKPLDWIHSHYNDNINLCIFLTDGYASNPRRPKYASKFIWVIFDNYEWEAPFGKVIKMSAGDV